MDSENGSAPSPVRLNRMARHHTARPRDPSSVPQSGCVLAGSASTYAGWSEVSLWTPSLLSAGSASWYVMQGVDAPVAHRTYRLGAEHSPPATPAPYEGKGDKLATR